MLNTVWKVIEEFPQYEISNLGEVRNSRGKVLKTFTQNCGHAVASFPSGQGKSSAKRTVHRLVAKAFYPIYNPEELQVNHKDGNKHNNHADNLEWLTGLDNVRHGIAAGLTTYNRPTLGKKLPPRGKNSKPTIYFGICWVAKSNFWLTRVQDKGVVVFQKAGFKEEIEAAKYYDEMVKLHGLNRPLNFPES